MRSPLRKITINSVLYLYRVNNKYEGRDKSSVTVKAFLAGQKQTPVTIYFLTRDHIYLGNPLNSGIYLPNIPDNTADLVNIHEPQYIREFLLLALKKGWTGNNKIDIQNGLEYLEELGYDITDLLPFPDDNQPKYQ